MAVLIVLRYGAVSLSISCRHADTFWHQDIYEFIQRRADWKKIEKTVDKAMYNLSFKEDCIIS